VLVAPVRVLSSAYLQVLINLSLSVITDLSKERWYDQTSGKILLDGVDIRELNLTWLRTNVRLVQQEPVLFSGTVYENVASGLFGTDKADLPEAEQRALIEKACKDAYADEFIARLPKVSLILYQYIRAKW
jgi:ABC-type multidrug transport system fused ATPase/permease subunit